MKEKEKSERRESWDESENYGKRYLEIRTEPVWMDLLKDE
mgnify:CR=1 FL=1